VDVRDRDIKQNVIIMKLNNKYYIMRHGEALSNVREIVSNWPETFENFLTERGVKMVEESAEKLVDKKIDLIFCSPLLRTKQTAEIVGKKIGKEAEVDKRLKEIDFGEFNGKSIEEMWASFKKEEDRIEKGADGGESYDEILKRLTDFMMETDKKYEDKNILLVSHECPLFLLQGWAMGLTIKETIEKFPNEKRIHKAEIRQLN